MAVRPVSVRLALDGTEPVRVAGKLRIVIAPMQLKRSTFN